MGLNFFQISVFLLSSQLSEKKYYFFLISKIERRENSHVLVCLEWRTGMSGLSHVSLVTGFVLLRFFFSYSLDPKNLMKFLASL